MGHNVLVHVHVRQAQVQHADLLPLIDKRRAALEHIHCSQHLAALVAVGLVAVAADYARVIVIFDIQRVPAASGQLILPVAEGALHLDEIEGQLHHVYHEAVRLHMREGDHLVEHLIRPLGDILEGDVRRGQRAFADGEAVVAVEHIALELHEVLVHPRAV